jgi:hypothetical protein
MITYPSNSNALGGHVFRQIAIFACSAAAAAALAACGSSTTPGSGSLSLPFRPSGGTTTSPSFPASSPTSSPVTPSVTAPVPSISSPTTSGCPTGAKYCDTFASSDSGWPVGNQTNYFAQYDNFKGGTYRLGERKSATISEDAPFDITTIAPNFSVKIDVDAIRGQSMPAAGDEGISCWEHQAASGAGPSAFLFFLDADRVEIGLWDGENSDYHRIAQKTLSVLHTDGQTADHLTAECLQTSNGSAALSIAVNGQAVLSTTYANGVQSFEWRPAGKVGVLAGGQGSDVFYDNFAIST